MGEGASLTPEFSGRGVGSRSAKRAASSSSRGSPTLRMPSQCPGGVRALAPWHGAGGSLPLLPPARRAPVQVCARQRGPALAGDPIPRFAVQASAKAAGVGGGGRERKSVAGGSAPKPGRRGGGVIGEGKKRTGRLRRQGKTQAEKDRRNWFGGAGAEEEASGARREAAGGGAPCAGDRRGWARSALSHSLPLPPGPIAPYLSLAAAVTPGKVPPSPVPGRLGGEDAVPARPTSAASARRAGGKSRKARWGGSGGGARRLDAD